MLVVILYWYHCYLVVVFLILLRILLAFFACIYTRITPIYIYIYVCIYAYTHVDSTQLRDVGGVQGFGVSASGPSGFRSSGFTDSCGFMCYGAGELNPLPRDRRAFLIGLHKTLNWIHVRDPLYFLGYGIPYIYVKRILFSS